MDAWEASLREQAERARQWQRRVAYPYSVAQQMVRGQLREKCRLEECSRPRTDGGSWYCAEHERNLRSWTASMF